MSVSKGLFIISLDFELFWGIHDQEYSNESILSLKRTRKVVSRLLELFNKYSIHTTFSTVGFLFAEDKEKLQKHIPKTLPSYSDTKLSPYSKIDTLPLEKESSSSIYFASTLIDEIKKSKNMEIGTHTFSHFYSLEDGQTIHAFKEDIQSAISIAKSNDINIKSIVFPRNQYSKEHIQQCKSLGIECYRGNENSWIYKSEAWSKESIIKKGARLLDSFINISGHHGYLLKKRNNEILNIPSSRFLRPYNPRLAFLDVLKLNRIKKSMTHCAKNKLVYHLWWHPHNFRIHSDKNFLFLEQILKHYNFLNKEYKFESMSMLEATNSIK